jgi:hypothetical protein
MTKEEKMRKRLYLLGLCIVGLLLPSWGQDGRTSQAKGKVMIAEHLNWVQTGYGEYILNTTLSSPVYDTFNSGPFLTFNVPPSPKAEALFFEVWGQSVHYWWVGYSPQQFSGRVEIQLVSSRIPAGITVYCYYGITGIYGITHDSQTPDRSKRSGKFILRRDSMLREYIDWWDIYNADGSRVPRDQAQIIVNDLIDNGFDVEISVTGFAEGVKKFFFYGFCVETTRLVKKQ